MQRKMLSRQILEVLVVIMVLAVLFYFSIVLKIWVAENKLVFNIFKSESGLVLIGIAIVVILLYLFKDFLTGRKK